MATLIEKRIQEINNNCVELEAPICDDKIKFKVYNKSSADLKVIVPTCYVLVEELKYRYGVRGKLDLSNIIFINAATLPEADFVSECSRIYEGKTASYSYSSKQLFDVNSDTPIADINEVKYILVKEFVTLLFDRNLKNMKIANMSYNTMSKLIFSYYRTCKANKDTDGIEIFEGLVKRLEDIYGKLCTELHQETVIYKDRTGKPYIFAVSELTHYTFLKRYSYHTPSFNYDDMFNVYDEYLKCYPLMDLDVCELPYDDYFNRKFILMPTLASILEVDVIDDFKHLDNYVVKSAAKILMHYDGFSDFYGIAEDGIHFLVNDEYADYGITEVIIKESTIWVKFRFGAKDDRFRFIDIGMNLTLLGKLILSNSYEETSKLLETVDYLSTEKEKGRKI